jgi:phosphoenolpyruvate---glycerone phosphotransferase subunit DhaL
VSGEYLTVDQLSAWIRQFAQLIITHRARLTDLDAAIGDADHGINMERGMRAVCDQLDQTPPAHAGDLFKLVGMALVSNVGGASGPLYGTFFLRLGTSCGPRDRLSLSEFAPAVAVAIDGVVARGRAEIGDKTMLDSLQPGLEALASAVARSEPVDRALRSASAAANRGRDATIPLVARKGRASYLGERSAGHQDPGATSAALLFEAAAVAFADPATRGTSSSGRPGQQSSGRD